MQVLRTPFPPKPWRKPGGISLAPSSPPRRQARLADLERTPELARFWILVWHTQEVDLPIDFGKIDRE